MVGLVTSPDVTCDLPWQVSQNLSPLKMVLDLVTSLDLTGVLS